MAVLSQKMLWEVLVPTVRNDGRPFRTCYHRVWDEKVRNVSLGLTVMPPSISGQWISPEGDLYKERMIPVRIVATEAEIREIVTMTRRYYDQEAILYFLVSPQVKIHSEEDDV